MKKIIKIIMIILSLFLIIIGILFVLILVQCSMAEIKRDKYEKYGTNYQLLKENDVLYFNENDYLYRIDAKSRHKKPCSL